MALACEVAEIHSAQNPFPFFNTGRQAGQQVQKSSPHRCSSFHQRVGLYLYNKYVVSVSVSVANVIHQCFPLSPILSAACLHIYI